MRFAGIALAALLAAGPASAAPVLDPAFADGMVLQRGEPILVTGSAKPGAAVAGDLSGENAATTADATGRFTLQFAPRPASDEPLNLRVNDSDGAAEAKDILFGDVYLCSGQSNMELAVANALNLFNELRLANDTGLRLMQIPKDTAPTPRTRFATPVTWQAASADSIRDFSAACYFMGKDLRRRDKAVPVGLIHASWGGSASSAWQSPEAVGKLYGEDTLDALRAYQADPMAAAQAFAPRWYDWWRSNDGGREPWTDSAILDWKPVPRISNWNEWTGTGLDTQPVGTVWLRKRFTLTQEQARDPGALSLGALEDLDLTWVNGTPVGYTFGWGVERNYRVPAHYLRAGENEVLIGLHNMWDAGGFYAGPDRLFYTAGDGSAIPLGEGWQYSVSNVQGAPPRAPWDANAGMGVMHNAMIAPLGPVRLAGVAWYQGEADIGQPDYDTKLRELFAGWRRQFGDQARILVVQLADFGTPRAEPGPSGWAELRQDQLDGVAADANAALVTAIDIGEPSDIHPANKNVLGRRLAMAALGEAMPMPRAAVRSGDTITVRFDGVEGALSAIGGYGLGVELCGAEEGTCRPALPRLDGSALVVPYDGQPVTRIRHAWADAPLVNIYDARDLPLPGFEFKVTP